MRKILWSVVIIGILIAAPHLSYANGPGTTAASFLKIAVGARASAMGGAFTAVADDGTALYWNPAGLAQLEEREFSATYNSWFEEIKQGYVTLSFPWLGQTAGLGTNYVDMGSLEGRDEEGNPTGDFGASDLHIFAGYATKFENLNLGLTAGWLQDKIEKDTKTSFLGSIGLLYLMSERFSLGAVAQNIGQDLGADPLPLTIKSGIALRSETSTLAADIVMPKDDEVYYCAGLELWIGPLALRAGYKTDQDIAEGWSAGLGFKLGKNHLDYAYVPYGDLGTAHRISLAIRFW